MVVCIEGCDGTGKTTLIEKLCEKYKLDFVKMTSFGWKEIDSYTQKAMLENVVHDRCFISEYVYSSIYKRKSHITKEVFNTLLDLYRMRGHKIIILTCDVDETLRRIDERDIDSERREDLLSRKSFYETVAVSNNIKLIDTTHLNADEVLAEAIKYIEGCE